MIGILRLVIVAMTNFKGRFLVTKILVFLIFMFSSLLVFQIPFHSMTFFIALEGLFLVWMLFRKSKIVVPEIIFIFIGAELIISAALCYIGPLPLSYRKGALYSTFLILPSILIMAYLGKLIKANIEWIKVIKSGLKVMCLLQLVWGLIQFGFFYFGIDINQIIFVEVLKIVDVASSQRMVPTGFSWHPSTYAPVIVITFFLFDNIWIRLLAIFIGLICSNATTFLGTSMCVCCLIFESVSKSRGKFKQRAVLCILVAVAIFFIADLRFDILESIFEKIGDIWSRVFGLVADDSAIGHKRYFTALPQVYSISNPIQIIFGYGMGASGYPIDQLFHQFSSLELKNWQVECDIMDILYSRGIIGFMLYYYLLMYNIIKGYRINHKYGYFTFVIIFEGISYNVQYEWVFLIMMIFYFCIKNKLDFFADKSCNVANYSST